MWTGQDERTKRMNNNNNEIQQQQNKKISLRYIL